MNNQNNELLTVLFWLLCIKVFADAMGW